MLTELIEEYAKRYVEITVKTTNPLWPENAWHASVEPFRHMAETNYLPAFSFEAEGLSAPDLEHNIRRALTLCEPIVAHRERYLTSCDEGRKARREYLKANPVVVAADGSLKPNTGAIQ